MNELEKRSNLHKKKSKGLSYFTKLDAGDVPKGTEIFNNGMSADSSAEAAEGALGEEINKPIKGVKSMPKVINIRESLNTIDKNNFNKYDLLNLYEACNMPQEDKKVLATMLAKNESAEVIYKYLYKKSCPHVLKEYNIMKITEANKLINEEFDDSIDLDMETDFDDDRVHVGDTFIESGDEYVWEKGFDDYDIHLDFDHWQIWSAKNTETNEVKYFIVDPDNSFIDWGPMDTLDEAKEFYQSKIDDYEDDEEFDSSGDLEDQFNDLLDESSDNSFVNEENKEKLFYPSGKLVSDGSVDIDKALSYMYGTDRNLDNSTYTAEEKQRAINYWVKQGADDKDIFAESVTNGFEPGSIPLKVKYIIDKVARIAIKNHQLTLKDIKNFYKAPSQDVIDRLYELSNRFKPDSYLGKAKNIWKISDNDKIDEIIKIIKNNKKSSMKEHTMKITESNKLILESAEETIPQINSVAQTYNLKSYPFTTISNKNVIDAIYFGKHIQFTAGDKKLYTKSFRDDDDYLGYRGGEYVAANGTEMQSFILYTYDNGQFNSFFITSPAKASQQTFLDIYGPLPDSAVDYIERSYKKLCRSSFAPNKIPLNPLKNSSTFNKLQAMNAKETKKAIDEYGGYYFADVIIQSLGAMDWLPDNIDIEMSVQNGQGSVNYSDSAARMTHSVDYETDSEDIERLFDRSDTLEEFKSAYLNYIEELLDDGEPLDDKDIFAESAYKKNKDIIKENKYMNILKEAPEVTGSKINLLKYGFVRAPQEDFSDDGNRFICYYYDPNHSGDQRILLSKLVDNRNNQAYISAHYTNPESDKSTYFNDLNGVGIAEAIAGLPTLKADLDHFLDNIAELDLVVRLSDEDIEKYAQIIGPIPNGLNSTAGMNVLKDAGIDYWALDRDSKQKLLKAIKDATPIDKEAVKDAAKEYLTRILANMKPHKEGWGRSERWVEAKPLDQLLTRVYPITQFSDAIQDKIIAWAKDRIEKLYDFDV